MGTVAEKLTYLNGTKQDLKQAINNIGGSITSSTTFRNYATELNSIYSNLPKVSDTGTNVSLNSTLKGRLGIVPKGNTSQKILPDGYTQVDYIENSGTQYIDTGFIPDYDKGFKFDVDFIQATSSTRCCLISNYSVDKHISFETYTTGIRGYINNGAVDKYIIVTFSTTNKNNAVFEYKNGNYYLNVNDVTFTESYSIAGQSDGSVYLFVDRAKRFTVFKNIKIFGCKIYDEDKLVRNFIPCYRNSDNEVGMYDLVNDIFYTNQGTGDFTYGSVTPTPDTPVEIQSATGTQKVVVSGKNLVNPNGSTTTQNGITFTNNGDGSFTANGTATANTNFAITTTPIKLKNNTYYTQSVTTISGTQGGSITPAFKNSGGTITYNYFINNQTKLTTDEMTSHTYNYYIASGTSVNNWTFKVQLEKNNSATPCQPYQEPQEVDIELGNIELNKIGNYEDYIDGTPDNWVLYKKTRKISLNISDMNNSNSYPGWQNQSYLVDDYPNYNGQLRSKTSFYCNILGFTQTGIQINSNYANGVVFLTQNVFNLTQTQWKEQYPNLLFELVYGLQEYETTPITDTNLVSQLNELYYLQSYNDTTNIDVTGNLPMRITASAIKGE